MLSDQSLADRIRRVIGHQSARSFASKAGVSDSTLRSVLGGTKPTVDTFVAIASAGGVSLDWLATGEARTRNDFQHELDFYLEELEKLRKKEALANSIKEIEDIKEEINFAQQTISATFDLIRIMDLHGREEIHTHPESQTKIYAEGDEDLMALLIDGITSVYKSENIGLPPRDLGRLAERMRVDLVEAYDDPDERKVAVKGMLRQLQRTLREASSDGQAKHRA